MPKNNIEKKTDSLVGIVESAGGLKIIQLYHKYT